MPTRDTPRPGWRRLLPRGPRQIGRRGAVLLTYGILWIVVGLGVYGSAGIGQGLLHELIPSQVRGALWVGTGLLAVVYAWRPRGMSDALGFAALYLAPAIRVLSYGVATILAALPGHHPGAYDNAWRFLVIYAAMVAGVAITSGWKEPITRREVIDVVTGGEDD